MSSEERDQERGFKVADRRRFSETGEAREPADTTGSETAATPEAPSAAASAPAEEPAEGTRTDADDAIPEINFSTFIIGLSAQALAHLGEIPDPMHQAVRVDLEAARQVIDILGLLRDKTKGNLDSVEAPLLESVLYDLRMKYVERVRGS
jgi:hypothetical protein